MSKNSPFVMHPMYQQMLDRGFAKEELYSKAGYFDPNFPVKETSDFPVVDADIVLGLSGCFSPLHEGHIHALVMAKQHMEEHGFKKVKAIIYPAHDSYVDVKRNGEAACNIDQRSVQIKKMIKEYPWIFVDETFARELPEEVNFPYLVDKLQKSAGLGVSTAFVVGGDNAGFAYAFNNSPTSVCVVKRDKDIAIDYNRLGGTRYIELRNNKYSDLSSSKLRKPVYMIRDDAMFCGGHQKESFQKWFPEMLQKYTDAEVMMFNASEQLVAFDKWFRGSIYKKSVSISLDKYWKGMFQLDISRVFGQDDQQKPLYYHVANLEEFCQYCKTLKCCSEIVLVDDDIATGGSVQYVTDIIKSILPDIEVKSVAMTGCVDIHRRKMYDIIDLRDFIPNAKYGGLMTPYGRKMYLHPEVNLVNRMKLTEENAVKFTQELKEYYV